MSGKDDSTFLGQMFLGINVSRAYVFGTDAFWMDGRSSDCVYWRDISAMDVSGMVWDGRFSDTGSRIDVSGIDVSGIDRCLDTSENR